MTDAVECWLRGGWNLSFLEPDSLRFVDEHSNGSVWSDPDQCRKQSSLSLIVRRRRKHSYSEISPLPLHSSQLPSKLEKIEPRTDSEHQIFRENVNSTSSLSKTNTELSSGPLYQNQSTVCDRGSRCSDDALAPPIVPRRNRINHSSVYQNIPRVSLTYPEIQRPHAPSEGSSSSSSSSASSTDSRLLRPALAVCRFSASPAADDSSVFHYKDTEDAVPPSKPGFCHWRSAQCFTAWDQELLTKTFYRLTLCNFYLCKLSFNDAKLLLRHCPVGTFLLRDSSDQRFPFSLSIQTSRGATSIRIIYESGSFRLDSEQEQVHLMPTFDCVVKLIQFYVHQTTGDNSQRTKVQNNFVLLEMNGQRDIPVLLRKPFECRRPSLAHLCRKIINKLLGSNSVNRLQLLPNLKAFLDDYPYDI